MGSAVVRGCEVAGISVSEIGYRHRIVTDLKPHGARKW